MAVIDINDLDLLKNEAEQIVLTELEHQLKARPNYICVCKECLLDVMALTLNSIKPLYRVSLMGKIYTGMAMEEKAYAAYIREAVFRAIEKVHKNPFHSPHEKEEKEEEETAPNHFWQKKKKKGE
jgi:competence protein ComFB